jgi:hypothetical protein
LRCRHSALGRGWKKNQRRHLASMHMLRPPGCRPELVSSKLQRREQREQVRATGILSGTVSPHPPHSCTTRCPGSGPATESFALSI